MIYTSQKSHFATYTDGTQGIAYTLSLDNDYDTIVFDQQNRLISSLPITITATRMTNGDLFSDKKFEDVIITPADGWSNKVTFDKNTGRLEITQVPDGFTEATFEIRWEIKPGVILSKVFSLKKQVSNVDYEIETNKNVINSTNLGGTVNIKLKKKDINGSKYLTANDLETDSLTLTSSQTLTWNSGGYWTFNYDKGQAGAVTITLEQGTLVWDIETIEFVSDGERGPQGEAGKDGREEIKRDRYYCITNENKAPLLYENFNDATLWWKYPSSSVQFSENGLQIFVDDTIKDVTVFAMKAEQWPESRLVSFEGWITSEVNDDGVDVDEFYLNCDLVPRPEGSEDGYPQFTPRLTKERRRYSYLMELGPEANINNNKEVSLRLFSDISHNDNGDRVPNDIYIENLIIQPLSNNPTWTKNTYPSLEKGQYLWSFDIIEYSKEDAFGNKYSVTPIEWRAHLATDGTSPYLISFDNDSATIGATKDGTVDGTVLQNVSKVKTTVYFGQTDITDKCTFSWTVNGGTLNNTSTRTIYFTAMNSDTATATVSVTLDKTPIDTKTFTISKSIAGQTGQPGNNGTSAITYKLSVSPNSVNLSTSPDGVVPSFIVTKYTGSTVENISSGYTITRNDGKNQNEKITDKTIFTLKVNGVDVDTETVEVVTDGTPGKGVSSVVNYYLATDKGSGVTTNAVGWSTNVPGNFDSTNKYLWNYEITRDTDGNVISTTDPTIIGTWGQDGRGISSIEEYYATTTTTSQPADVDWVKVPEGSMPITDSTNKYLWNYEKIIYTIGNPTTTEPAIIGTYGDTGVGIQGTKTESIRVFYSSQETSKPAGPGGAPTSENKINIWTTYEPTSSSDYKYTWSCTGVKTTTYKDAAGTIDKVTYGSWTTPELYKAYTTNTNIDPLNYATFLRLSNFKSDQDIFYNSDGKMYINAELMNVGSLLVNDAFSVAINGGRKNLALEDGVSIYANPAGSPAEKIDAATCSWKLFCPIGIGTGICFPASFFVNETYYTLKFYIKPIEGELTSIAGHSSCAEDQKFYINGIGQDAAFTSGASVSPAPGDELECILIFKFKAGGLDDNLYIQPNRGNNYATACTCIISNITLYEGRGSYDNIITKINADQMEIKLQGNKIDFTTLDFVIKDTANNTLFEAYGSRYEDITKRGTVSIAGWTVNEKMLSKVPKDGELGGSNSLFLTTEDLEQTVYINGVGQKGWRLGIGNWFGVDSIGQLYARAAQLTEANITGTLTTGTTGTYTRIQGGKVENASLKWELMNGEQGYDKAEFTSGFLQFNRTSTDRQDGQPGYTSATVKFNPNKFETLNGGQDYMCLFEINTPMLELHVQNKGRLSGDWEFGKYYWDSETSSMEWDGIRFSDLLSKVDTLQATVNTLQATVENLQK